MDPISFSIGVASVASIFQTCLHGYRTLNTAMEIGDDALTLNVQFRVEELRLYLWGRNWGLLANSELEEQSGSDSDEISDDPIDAEFSADIPLDSVDEDLEIPGLRDLTIEVLGRIRKALEEWRSVGRRYGAAPGNEKLNSMDEKGKEPKKTFRESFSKISSKQSGQEMEISDRTRFTTKLRWAIKDKTTLEELLMRLTNLNDSLEKLLPRRQRANLARGLAGEILNVLEGAAPESYKTDIDERLERISGLSEIKAVQIVRLKRSNFTETDERMPKAKEGLDNSDAARNPTPFSKSSVWTEGEGGSMQIPSEHFVRLLEPKLKEYEIPKPGRGKWSRSKYVPLQRSVAVYVPLSPSSDQSTPFSDDPAQATLIEWRPTKHESRATELSEQDLKDRRDHIARLLHRTSITDADFRVLDCIGYTTTSAHTTDGATHALVGYVYRYPDFATPKSSPVTLRDLLGEAYNSNDPNVPSLEERFKLARSLSIALYNVIFFKDRKTDKLDLSRPFLGGWQYSRPDDQRRIHHSEGSAEGIGDLDMYVHRARLFDRASKFPRFRKSFDIYSLGVILIEIAFWKPIMALASESEREEMANFDTIESGDKAHSWWAAILKTAENELAPEMGTSYRGVVLFCLNASGEGPDVIHDPHEEHNPRDPYYWETNFEEVGIEKDFFWRVLKPLERFSL
ncbi:hypothetical protein LSUE1_G003762 [Lachnellula suecica]|uniref:Prion-inhibition and propagation HeLo domain-containing protein n=1 Tax=Lachnellula suecica TaxID=602035 RepID=A0A8T9CFT2_9HELO|nr:hypothetical protein LSUE1_G003762 [Lachnellula suecica]